MSVQAKLPVKITLKKENIHPHIIGEITLQNKAAFVCPENSAICGVEVQIFKTMVTKPSGDSVSLSIISGISKIAYSTFIDNDVKVTWVDTSFGFIVDRQTPNYNFMTYYISPTHLFTDIKILMGLIINKKILLNVQTCSGLIFRIIEINDPYTPIIVPVIVQDRTNVIFTSSIVPGKTVALHGILANVLTTISFTYNKDSIGPPTEAWRTKTISMDDSNIIYTNKTIIMNNSKLFTKNPHWIRKADQHKLNVRASDLSDVIVFDDNGETNYTIDEEMIYGFSINSDILPPKVAFYSLIWKDFKQARFRVSIIVPTAVYPIQYAIYHDVVKNITENSIEYDIAGSPKDLLGCEINGLYNIAEKNKCKAHADCFHFASTPYCYNEECVSCYLPSHCTSTSYCDLETLSCRATQQCEEDSECARFQLKKCYDTSKGNRCGMCSSDAECQEINPNFVCGFNNACVLANHPKQCSSNSECPPFTTCADGMCDSDIECLNTPDCFYGYNCVEGQCVPSIHFQCENNSDCDLINVCANDLICKPPSITCNDSQQCKDDEICSNGICIPLLFECKDTSDCPANLSLECVNNNCQSTKIKEQKYNAPKITIKWGTGFFVILFIFIGIVLFVLYKLIRWGIRLGYKAASSI